MKDKRYWIMTEPRQRSDSHENWLLFKWRNGALSELYGLPGVKCPCGPSRGSWAEANFACPEKFRDHKNILRGWPIDVEDFKVLIREIEKELAKEGIVFSEERMDRWQWMAPGMSFQPYEFRIACHPSFSFLWGGLGTSAIVTPEVKALFEGNGVTGVCFHEVDITSVGKASADHYAPDFDNDFEDENDRIPPPSVEREKDPKSFGPLYYMQANRRSPDWRGKVPEWPLCPECGRLLDVPKGPEDDQVFTADNLADYDMFRSSLVDGIVVSDKVYRLIQESDFTNKPLFKELEIADT